MVDKEEIVRTISELLTHEVDSLLEAEKQYLEFLHSQDAAGRHLWEFQLESGRKVKEIVIGYLDILSTFLPREVLEIINESPIETGVQPYPYGDREIVVDLAGLELYDGPESSLSEEQWFWNGSQIVDGITNKITHATQSY